MGGTIVLCCVFGFCMACLIGMLVIPIVVYEKSHKDNNKKGNKGVD